jgi:membrane-associated PAP2 superfamily phosphatase
MTSTHASLSRSASTVAPGADRLLLVITATLALVFLGWESADGDLLLAHWAGGVGGFALRDHWLLSNVMHGGARWLAWALALALCLAVWWPIGVLQRLTLSRRLQLAGGVLLSVLTVSVLKSFNPAACPWDLASFGGVAQPVSHWLWWATPIGGSGRCFPAGHASAGFAFIGGYFVFRRQAPELARRWLLAAVVAGLVLGLAQQWRGAHFMSHTLWSGWLCWCLAWGLDAVHGRLAPAAQRIDAGQA